MKPSSLLPRRLRLLFFGLQIAVVVFTGYGAVRFALNRFDDSAKSNSTTFRLPAVDMWVSPRPFPFKLTGIEADSANLAGLQARIVFRNARHVPDTALRWSQAASAGLFAVFFYLLFALLKQLFRDIEQGFAFSSTSVRRVRQIGLLVLGFALIHPAVDAFARKEAAELANRHLALEGSELRFAPAQPTALFGITFGRLYRYQSNGAELIAGVLVLALGEVFRQGMALKEENALTI